MAGQVPQVLVVDDQLVVRRGVELLLRDEGFRIAGVAGSAAETRSLLRRRHCDVVLIELMLEGRVATDLVAELMRQRPGVPFVVYAGRRASDAALAAAAALDVAGLVLKASAPSVLCEALRAVAAGAGYTDPALAHRLPVTGAKVTARSGVALLSPREREVLVLLAEGLSGAEIARRLFLSGETVRTHVRNAVQKLGARTRTQAVALVVAAGAVPAPLAGAD